MAYDAYEFQKTLERPAITVRRGALGRWWRRLLNRLPGVDLEVETTTYTGRLLSHGEFLDWMQRFGEVGDGAADARKMLRGFLLDMQIPPSVVLDLPGAVQEEVLADFFDCQLRAQVVEADVTESVLAEFRTSLRGTASPNGSGTERAAETTSSSPRASRSPSSAGPTDPNSTGDGTGSHATNASTPATGASPGSSSP